MLLLVIYSLARLRLIWQVYREIFLAMLQFAPFQTELVDVCTGILATAPVTFSPRVSHVESTSLQLLDE